MFQEVIVTNTIPVASEMQFPCLTVLSVRPCPLSPFCPDVDSAAARHKIAMLPASQVANLVGETIWRVYASSSVLGLGQ